MRCGYLLKHWDLYGPGYRKLKLILQQEVMYHILKRHKDGFTERYPLETKGNAALYRALWLPARFLSVVYEKRKM